MKIGRRQVKPREFNGAMVAAVLEKKGMTKHNFRIYLYQLSASKTVPSGQQLERWLDGSIIPGANVLGAMAAILGVKMESLFVGVKYADRR